MHKFGEQKIEFRAKFSGRWPPNTSPLAGLGFDSISLSKSSLILKKSSGTSLLGAPASFTQIEIRKDSVLLLHRHRDGLQSGTAMLSPALLLIRTLSLVPRMALDVQSASEFLAPLLESAEAVATTPYQLLAKKYEDLQSDFAELSAKSHRMLADSESHARRNLELEKRLSILQERVKKLESVSDSALRELLSEWLSSHKGRISIASFCGQTGIPPSRCEEGLEMLLKEGAITEIPSGYAVVKNSAGRTFQQNQAASLLSFRGARRSLASSASKLFGRKPS
ncbi:MAG: hypothetical protein QW568_02675 [Candidatus Anstonellaceae archaeon]